LEQEFHGGGGVVDETNHGKANKNTISNKKARSYSAAAFKG